MSFIIYSSFRNNIRELISEAIIHSIAGRGGPGGRGRGGRGRGGRGRGGRRRGGYYRSGR